jgi:hypothetical protein
MAVAAVRSEAAPEPQAEATTGPFRYDSKGRRDPFAPLVREGRLIAAGPGQRMEASTPVLYGILWDPSGHSIAMINDGEVRVGDWVGQYQVTKIEQDAVVLDSGTAEPLVLTIAFEVPTPVHGTPKGGEGR